jgi:hypothetical protein
MRNSRVRAIATWAALLATSVATVPISAQVRGARRTAVVRGEEGRAAAVGRRGVAVKTEEGYAAAGRRGAVVKGDEGYAAVGRRGAVVHGEDGYARVGPRGASSPVRKDTPRSVAAGSSLATDTRVMRPGAPSPASALQSLSAPCSRGRRPRPSPSTLADRAIGILAAATTRESSQAARWRTKW